MSCNTGLDNAILTILNNKPWFQYKSGDKYIKILNSPNGNINESNSIGVAKTIADTINKSINNGNKSVGKIAYEEFDGKRGVVKITPTSKQLDLINSEDEEEIKQLLQDEELIKRQEEFKQLEDEANQTVNEEGDVVIKNNVNLEEYKDEVRKERTKEQAKESIQIVNEINNSKNYHAEAIKINDNSHYIEIFEKEELPEEYKRVYVDKNLTSQELGSEQLNKVLWKMKQVFPDFSHQVINESRLGELLPNLTNEELLKTNAFIIDKTVYLVEGKFTPEMVAEEFLHPFILSITQDETKLNELYSEASKLYDLKDIFNQYSSTDENTAKREVVTRALSYLVKEELTKEKESFLKKILNLIRKIFSKFNTTSTLEKLASTISNDDIQLDYLTTDQPQFNIGLDAKDLFERFKQNPIENGLRKEEIIDNGIKVEVYKNKFDKIVRRVSDIIKESSKKYFQNNRALDEATAETQALWEIQREKGSQIHKDIENLIRLFIDTKTGLKIQGDIDTSSFRSVATIVDSYKDNYQKILETYVRELLDTYSDDTRFLLENLFVNTKAKDQLAGTIDFIAITPDGIDILDWKTIYKLKDGKIATYKKDNWKEQLAQYKGILKQEFQLSDSDFRYSRVIPILPILSANNMKQDIEKISIGKVKTKEETNFNLLPFLSDSDSLLKSGMGDFMTKLVAVIEKQEETESERRGVKTKDYILTAELEEAVQSAVLQNNYSKIFNFIINIEKKSKETIDEIKNKLKDGQSLTPEENKYYSALTRNLSETVVGLKGFFDYSQKELDEESKKNHNVDIGRITTSILSFESHVKDINKALVTNIGEREGFINIKAPEKVISWWDANFKRFSRGPTKSIKLLQSVLRPVFSNITIQRKDAVIKGQTIGHKLMSWGQRNNKTQQEVFNMFLTTDRNGKPILSEKKSVDFYKARLKAKDSKADSIQFIKDNYDLDAFNKKKEEYLKGQFAKIDGYFKTDEEKKALKLRETNNLDITIKPQYLLTNPMLDEFLKEELWYSDFFKTISKKENSELLEFWDYINDIIKRAKDTGISDEVTNRFVPQKLKDIYETETKKLWSKYIEGLKISPDQYEYGSINPITGLQENKINLNFTRDLGESIEGEAYKKNYSNVSTDLLRSFMAFDYDLIEKENMQTAEDFSEVLSDFEAANKVINVGKLGGILKFFNNGVTKVSEVEQGKDGMNAKAYDGFKKLYIYNQQIQDYTDFAIKIGKDEYISGIKTIKKVVQTARSSAFALNVMSPLRNLILGKINTWINTNPHFSPSFDPSADLHILDDIFINLNSLKDKQFVALLEYFLPLASDNFQKELNHASMRQGIRKFSFDNMQLLMRNSDDVVQIKIFKELMKNSTIRDGKVVNINIWVKEQHKINNNYSDFYKLSLEDRNKYQKQIDDEIRNLKKNDTIYKYLSVKNDIVNIKGLDRNDSSVAYLRNLNRQYSAEATGALSLEDKALSGTSFMMQMMSMYRSWIAPTVGVRAGKFDYIEQGITEGRMRSMVKYLKDDTEKKSKKVKNLLMGAMFGVFDKESLIQVAKDLRKKKINQLKEDGKYSKEITEDEFVEMYLRNIDSAFKDLRATFTLFILVSLGLASSLMGGGSNDDKKTNLQKIVERELKKYNNELTFYYNPLEALSIIKNPFPVTTYIDNYLKIITNTLGEPFNPDKNHPMKYLLRSFPVTNMVASYLPIIDDNTAKELGIKLTTNYGIR